MSILNPNLGERLRNMSEELENAYRNGDSGVIRQWRDFFLARCDWTQATDSPLNAEQKAAWAEYRQALRDITSQEGFPENVQWPSTPSA